MTVVTTSEQAEALVEERLARLLEEVPGGVAERGAARRPLARRSARSAAVQAQAQMKDERAAMPMSAPAIELFLCSPSMIHAAAVIPAKNAPHTRVRRRPRTPTT